jgi:hypothetical protein
VEKAARSGDGRMCSVEFDWSLAAAAKPSFPSYFFAIFFCFVLLDSVGFLVEFGLWLLLR